MNWTCTRPEAPSNRPRPRFPSSRSACARRATISASCWACRRKSWRPDLDLGPFPPRRRKWPSACLPTCCGAAPTFAGPSVWRPPNRRRSASPRPTSIRPFRSTERWDTRPQFFPDLFRSAALTGSVGPSFQWNLLNYGRILNNVRLQDARFQELVTIYQQTVLNANQEVENGLVTFLRAQRRTNLQAASVADAEKAVADCPGSVQGGHQRFHARHPGRAEPGATAGRAGPGPGGNRNRPDPSLSGPWEAAGKSG